MCPRSIEEASVPGTPETRARVVHERIEKGTGMTHESLDCILESGEGFKQRSDITGFISIR